MLSRSLCHRLMHVHQNECARWRTQWAAVAMICIPGQLLAQGSLPLRRALDGVRWAGEFSAVVSAQPLRSGIIVIDGREVRQTTPSGGDRQTVRTGDGPREVRAPRQLMAYRGDSVLVAGQDQRVLLVISPTGEPVRTMSLRSLGSSTAPLQTLVGSTATGQLLYLAPDLSRASVDSAALMLVQPDGSSARRIGSLWYRLPGAGGAGSMETGACADQHDQALLLSTGMLVVFRCHDVALDFYREDGAPIRRVLLPHKPRKLNSAENQLDKEISEKFLKDLESRMARLGPKARQLMLDAARDAAQKKSAIQPPYESRGLMALSAEVLVMQRTPEPQQSTILYDWVNARTGQVGQLTLPDNMMIMGASRQGVVLARMSASDNLVQLGVVPAAALLSR